MTVGAREPSSDRLPERLLDAAAEITCDSGWGEVTMAKIAGRVGVSRQTVYNELGSKPAIAEALVLRELGRFLEVVTQRLRAHRDVVDGVREAAEQALLFGQDNALLKAALTSAHGGGNDLLPLLTTRSDRLIEQAVAVVSAVVHEQYGDLGLADAERQLAVETLVRLVLSHVLQPHHSAAATSDHIAWIAQRVLRRPG